MQATNRIFTDHETGLKCRLYTSQDASRYHLVYEGNDQTKIADGCEVNGFYLSANFSATIKLNNKKEVSLRQGEFYSLKEGEKITHTKPVWANKFIKA